MHNKFSTQKEKKNYLKATLQILNGMLTILKSTF